MALFACAALSVLAPSSAAAEAFEPHDLHVVGGDGWHADRSFELRWSNPDSVAAVHYRVLAESGQTAVGETTIEWPATAVEYLNVPPVPAVYTAEVWLEDATGGLGAPASAKLRFDDGPPGRSEVAPLPTWIGRNAFPLTIRLGRPEGAEPLSGVRGYAFSIDRDPEGEPCAAAKVCSVAETDLSGGPLDDTTLLAGLPEGTSYLHAVAVSGSGVRSATTSTVPIRVDAVDPMTTLSGVSVGWSNTPLRLFARATDSASGMAMAGGSHTPFTAIRVDGGAPIAAAGDSVATTVIGSGIHTVAYYARDAAGNVDDGAVVDGHRNADPGMALVRIDRDPPTVAFAAAQDPDDPERVEARVDDSLSGFDRLRGSIATRPAGSRQRFVELPTVGHGGALEAVWDSAVHPHGVYEFRATAYDMAGNSSSTTLRSNGSRMLLRSPLKAPTTLLAVLDDRSVAFGRSVRLHGRLLMGQHTPLAGRPVRVLERFDPGSLPRERITVVTTDRDGRFAVRLAAGPSREVLAVAPPTPTLASASSRPTRLVVRGQVDLRVSASVAKVGGRPVVFRGRVGGTPLPDDGKAVQLQFRLPGRRWSEFRTVKTDARGRFRYAYRFVDDDSRGARFQFRAFAPAQAGWPFEAAGSRPVSVEGR